MMRAGTYYVGDLCYVMKTEWSDVLKKMYPNGYDKDSCEGELMTSSGVKFAYYGTAHGDGSYYDQAGRRYSVDAGLIGCVRWDDIVDQEDAEDIVRRNHGQKIEFDYDFYVSYEPHGGLISIGNINIETDPDLDDDYDYDYEEDEE
jgi:hypothetical protein